MFQGGVELNWLPPTEPNGEVHYVIEYKREDSGNWTSVNTTSDSTHYNLTGLHSGTNYSIRVVAVNSAARVHTETPVPSNTVNLAGVVAGVVVACLLLLALLIAGIIIGVVLRRRTQGGVSPQKKAEAGTKGEGSPQSRGESPDMKGSRGQLEAKDAQPHNPVGLHLEEQHYETTDTVGLDWFGKNVKGAWSEGHHNKDSGDHPNDEDGNACNDAQTVEHQGTLGIKYVMVDHSVNVNRWKAPAIDAADQRVMYATVDVSKKLQHREADELGADVKMGDTHYNLPTHCAQSK